MSRTGSLRLACILLALGAPALAQEQEPGQKRAAVERPPSGFVWRDKEMLHPSMNPLEISGLEQGDNDFRARTPALARSDRAVAYVDTEALRERKLALYSGKRAQAPPPPRRELPEAQLDAQAPDKAEPAPSDEPSGVPWLAMLCGATFAGVLTACFLMRRGPA